MCRRHEGHAISTKLSRVTKEKRAREDPPIGFDLIKALFPREGSELEMHVLALELPQLSK